MILHREKVRDRTCAEDTSLVTLTAFACLINGLICALHVCVVRRGDVWSSARAIHWCSAAQPVRAYVMPNEYATQATMTASRELWQQSLPQILRRFASHSCVRWIDPGCPRSVLIEPPREPINRAHRDQPRGEAPWALLAGPHLTRLTACPHSSRARARPSGRRSLASRPSTVGSE